MRDLVLLRDRSAIQRGYFEDPFLHYFVRRRAKRSPLINRGGGFAGCQVPSKVSARAVRLTGGLRWRSGYYSRMAALRELLLQFLQTGAQQPKQVLSLGAGFDTLFFQLQVLHNICKSAASGA